MGVIFFAMAKDEMRMESGFRFFILKERIFMSIG